MQNGKAARVSCSRLAGSVNCGFRKRCDSRVHRYVLHSHEYRQCYHIFRRDLGIVGDEGGVMNVNPGVKLARIFRPIVIVHELKAI